MIELASIPILLLEQIEIPTTYTEYGSTAFYNGTAGWVIFVDLKKL